MSSPHPPQVKWSSFLLLLTLLMEFPSPATSGRCEERCENNRFPGTTEAYVLDCDKEYAKPNDVDYCKKDCDSCESSVCTPWKLGVYNCPPVTRNSKLCKERCDKYRGAAYMDKYQISVNCRNLDNYPTAADREHCFNVCFHCPREFCKLNEPETVYCPSKFGPSPSISGRCLDHCNINRPAHSTSPYTLSCKKAYSTVKDVNICRYACSDDTCPHSVCDPYNPDIYHCPAAPTTTTAPPPPPPPTYKGPCEDQCDDNRAKGPYGLLNDAYTLKCDEKYWDYTEKRHCQNLCTKCPATVCDPDQNENVHHCPRLQVEKRCDDICIANRKYGTTEAYTFKCSTEYSSNFELNYCMTTCQDCSNTVCDYTSDNDTYNCPKVQDHSVGNPEDYPDRYSNGYPGHSRSPNGEFSTMLIVGGVIILLLIVLCAGVCIYCCVKKKKPMAMAQTGQYYGAPGAGVYPTGGQYAQQQPYQMNQYAQQQPYQMNQYAASPRSVGGSSYGR